MEQVVLNLDDVTEYVAEAALKRIKPAGEHLRICCNCECYEGVHECHGNAPCLFWGIKGVMWNDFCSRFKKCGLAEEIYQILIEEGQHNLKFKLGEIISNTPDEVRDIIKKHRNELGT